MELHTAVEDFSVVKILASASYAGLDIKIVKGCKEADLVKLHPQARSIVLKTVDGFLTQHTAILRYIAEMLPSSALYGDNNFESAQV
eukprot:gene14399-19445_t